MSKKSIVEYLQNGKKGVSIVENRKFEKDHFLEFLLQPSKKEKIVISNVVFEDCVVDFDAVIESGVLLKDVIIKNMSCGKTLHLDSSVEMHNVKIKGNQKPSMIWIRGANGSQKQKLCEEGAFALDISEYFGEVSITGLNSELVKRNCNEHILINARLANDVDWKGLGLNLLSYWRLMSRKVVSANSDEGIFSLPPKSGRNYDKSMAELDILRKEGFIDK